MYISIIIRSENNARELGKSPGKQGKVGIIQYTLWYDSPMSYNNYITPLGACSTILTDVVSNILKHSSLVYHIHLV